MKSWAWVCGVVVGATACGDMAPASSSDRLRVQYVSTNDGLDVPISLYDTEHEVACLPEVASDGVVRCLPVAMTDGFSGHKDIDSYRETSATCPGGRCAPVLPGHPGPSPRHRWSSTGTMVR